MESAENNGLYRKVVKNMRGGGYDFLKDSLIGRNGFTRYWDTVARAPYIFNPDSKIFITYDDEQSTKDKCEYVKKNKLGGAMFWEYNDDKKEYLLSVIAKQFNY
jgi:chitinase